jgi:hypothetical protein
LAWVTGTVLVLGAPVVPTFSSDTANSKPLSLTGEYQLYCPDPVETPIVLHVRATATIAPAAPASKRMFSISGFQTEVTFPQGVASALAQMSPITGRVTGTVLVVGASPHSRPVAESFVAIVPAKVPRGGFDFWVPVHGVSLGTFSASSKVIAVEEASRFQLTLTVGRGSGQQTRVLACTAFANNTRDFEPAQPWVGTKEPPFADAIVPVIATR